MSMKVRWCHAVTIVPREKVMVRLGVCFNGVTSLLILDEGAVDRSCYIKNIHLIALKYGNKIFGDKWIFQQDNANSHRNHLTEEWSCNNYLSLIDKDRWPPSGPDLNSLDYSILDKLINVIDWNKVRSKTSDTDWAIKIVSEQKSEVSRG